MTAPLPTRSRRVAGVLPGAALVVLIAGCAAGSPAAQRVAAQPTATAPASSATAAQPAGATSSAVSPGALADRIGTPCGACPPGPSR